MNTNADTKELIGSVLAGNTNDFAEIIEQYRRLVSHIIFKMVSHETEREDLCQDVFVKVFKNLGSFKFESKFSTWIGRIAYNTAVNYLEKKKVPLFSDMIDNESADVDIMEGNMVKPDQYTENSNISDILRMEINELPIQYRVIISLYHIDDMTYQEISEITGLKDGTVKSHLFRGRKLLKERLTEKYRKEDLWQ